MKLRIRFSHIILLLIIAQVLFFIFNHRVIFDPFFTDISERTERYNRPLLTSFHVNSSADYQTTLVFKEFYRESIFNVYENDSLVHTTHINGLSKNHTIHLRNSVFGDEEENKFYAVGTQKVDQYYLYTFSKDENIGRWDHSSYFVHQHELYKALRDSVYIVDGKKFYSPNLKKDNQDILISRFEDGFRLELSVEQTFELMYPIAWTKDHLSDEIIKVSEDLSNNFDIQLSPRDLFVMLHFFNRNQFYEEVLSTFKNPSNHHGFLSPQIIGVHDVNGNGKKEVFIHINGFRWQSDRLICYDILNQKVLWKRDFSVFCENFQFIDIDSNGYKELVFTTGSPGNQPDLQHLWKVKEVGTSVTPALRVLNLDGTDKTINGHKVKHFTSYPFSTLKYLHIPERNEFLIGVGSNFYLEEKNLELYNFEENTVKKLDITSINLAGIHRKKNRIYIYDSHRDLLRQLVLDKNYNIIETKETKSKQLFLKIEPVRIWNQNFLLSTPVGIFDEKLRSYYLSQYVPVGLHYQFIDNRLYANFEISDRLQGRVVSFKSLQFNRKIKYNYNVIFFIIIQLIIISAFIYFKTFLRMLLGSESKNTAYLISFANLCYIGNISGAVRKYYSFPQKLSFSKDDFLRSLSTITNTYKCFLVKNFIVLRLEVYEFDTPDEFLIIKTLSHDTKNLLIGISLKIKLAQRKNKTINSEFLEIILTEIESTSHKLLNLTNFTKINKMNFEKIDIKRLFRDILMEVKLHPLYQELRLNELVDDIFFYADRELFKTAIKNLLNNAIEASFDKKDSEIIVNISDSEKFIYIEISNTGNLTNEILNKIGSINYSTKENGSGVGFLIAKSIIQKHQGKISINSDNNRVKVTIIIPKNYKKRGK